MKLLDIIGVLAVMYLFALMFAQQCVRTLNSKRMEVPKRIWKFEVPTKQEMLYALIAEAVLVILMIKLRLFD